MRTVPHTALSFNHASQLDESMDFFFWVTKQIQHYMSSLSNTQHKHGFTIFYSSAHLYRFETGSGLTVTTFASRYPSHVTHRDQHGGHLCVPESENGLENRSAV